MKDYQPLENHLQNLQPEVPLNTLKKYLDDLAQKIKQSKGIPPDKRQWKTLFLESTWRFLLMASRRAQVSTPLFDPEDLAQDLFLEISTNYLDRLLYLRKACWTTYLHSCIRHKVYDALRAARKNQSIPITLEDGETHFALTQKASPPHKVEEELCNQLVLGEIREKLSPREFFLITATITLQELATLYGQKPWQIHREKKRILARLQRLLHRPQLTKVAK